MEVGSLLSTRVAKVLRIFAVTAVAAVLAAACSTTKNESSGSGGSSSGDKKIALLLPETKTTRYEAQDKPLFEAKVKAVCPDCQILYSNADQKGDVQQNHLSAPDASTPLPSLPELPNFDQIYQ